MNNVSKEQFDEAYFIIMEYIDDKPNSRALFHALLGFKLTDIKTIDDEDTSQSTLNLGSFGP